MYNLEEHEGETRVVTHAERNKREIERELASAMCDSSMFTSITETYEYNRTSMKNKRNQMRAYNMRKFVD